MKYRVGQRFLVGGKYGSIMTISEINDSYIVLVEPNCTFYFHEGDCPLIPVKDYEQLSLF